MRDIDAMLADHDAFAPDNLAELGVVSEDGPKPRPYGTTPRSRWPGNARRWTDAELEERAYWIKKLYHEDGLALSVVAETLGLSDSTVRNDLRRRGLLREDGRIGKGTPRTLRMQRRQESVKRVFDERKGRVTGAEIARILGENPSTVSKDMTDLGLVSKVSGQTSPGLDRTIGRAVRQLAEMGEFLLNHHELHLLSVSPETADEWRKQLSVAVRGISRVRKHLN